MATKGNRKQITFDLKQEALRQFFPKGESTSPIHYKKAYTAIRRFMKRNGFDHRQYSVYISKEKLTTVDVVVLMSKLAEAMPWLFRCVTEIDVTNIGNQHSLLQSLEEATNELNLELPNLDLPL